MAEDMSDRAADSLWATGQLCDGVSSHEHAMTPRLAACPGCLAVPR
jgi:hypothetical protein